MNSHAAKEVPKWFLAIIPIFRRVSNSFVFMKTICLNVSFFAQCILHSVMTPRRPSDPMKTCFKSNPLLFFRTFEDRSRTEPSASTTFMPVIFPRKGPNFIKYLPPALVARLPPKRQEPEAPKSHGI